MSLTPETQMRQFLDARTQYVIANRLFELLLGTELVGVSALALTAVGSTGWQTRLEGFLG